LNSADGHFIWKLRTASARSFNGEALSVISSQKLETSPPNLLPLDETLLKEIFSIALSHSTNLKKRKFANLTADLIHMNLNVFSLDCHLKWLLMKLFDVLLTSVYVRIWVW